MSKQTVPLESDSVGVNVSVFVLHHGAVVLFLCDSSGVAPSLRCCQPNNISSSSLKNNTFCVYVRLISFVVPSPPILPNSIPHFFFYWKKMGWILHLSCNALLLLYCSIGLGETAKNIIVVIFRIFTLFYIYIKMYVFALKSVFMVQRTPQFHQKNHCSQLD